MSDFFTEQFGKADLTAAPAKRAGGSSSGGEEGQLTVDVYQTDEEIVIKSTIAGVTVDDIDISITSDMVTIKGKRKPDEQIDQSDYYYQELYWGPFSRSIILPEDIDVEKASASMKNGILTLRLPKLAKSRMKKVKISS
jgi:HSP20 family protein